jgi:branched-chain amino acid transport system permease protein
MHSFKNLIWAVIFGLVIGLLFIQKPFVLLILSTVYIYGIAALGLNIVSGYTGQISIGHASFMLIGAYTTALLSLKLHTPFVLNLFVGMVFSGILGLCIGLPALRLRGFYLAIATMAFGIAVEQFVSAVDFFGGPLGIKGIPRFFPSEFSVYLLNLGFLIVLSYLVNLIIRSPAGIKYRMVRDSEMAAAAYGIKTSTVKLNSFVVSAVICGIAGSLYAHTFGYINPLDFGLMNSVYLFAAIIIGGMASITGGLLGVVIIYGLPFLFSRSVIPMNLIIGPLLIIFVLFAPHGIVYSIKNLYSKYFQRPYIWLVRAILRARRPEGKLIDVNGKTIHYVQNGDGKPVIMIHGNLACYKWYCKVWDLRGYRTYAIDLINHGRSAWTDEVSIDIYADYVLGFMDAMGIRSAIVVGHSLGGLVGMSLAFRNPDRVEKLILVAAGPPDGIAVPEERYPVYKRLKSDRLLLRQYMELVVPTLNDGWLLSRLINYTYLQNPMLFTANPREVEKVDLTPIAADYRSPVLFMLGEKDTVISREMAERTLNAIGGAGDLKLYDHIGHSPIIEDPECFKRAFYEFVGE